MEREDRTGRKHRRVGWTLFWGLTVVAGFPSLYWLVGSVVRLRCRKTFEGDGPSEAPGELDRPDVPAWMR